MEVLRRRKDDDKTKQEEAQEKAKEEAKLKHGGVSGAEQDIAPSKVLKDDSLEKLLHQQLSGWEKSQRDAEEEAKKERTTLHNIELPNLKPAAFGVWRALHDLSYPIPKEVSEDLEESGIPKNIQEDFKIGFHENVMDMAQNLSKKFGAEELQVAGIQILKDFAEKQVPVLIFPYFRDEEICFIACRALLSKEERKELGIPRYVRLGQNIPFPYNANVFDGILNRERKKIFFLYPSRYRLNMVSKEEDVLVVAEKGFDAIAIRDFRIEDEWLKLFIQVEPVLLVDSSDKNFPNWQQKAEVMRELFAKHDMVMRIEVLPEGVDVPQWFVKSNLGERKVRFDKPPQGPKR